MAEKTEKMLITKTYGEVDFKKSPQVSFDVDRFDSAIINKGYNVIHYRALRCPCINRESHSPLPNCDNCSGIGWFYIEKKETKALMQSLGNSKKFDSWSETNAGTTTITTLWEDDVTYMDKFEITDLESNFSQILFLQTYQDKLFAFTIYEPLRMMNIFMFQGSENPLKPLYSKTERPSDWDYYLDKNKVVFNTSKYNFNDDISVSVRYKHTPVYCVIDIMRELFKTKDQACSELCDEKGLTLRGMPQKSLGRRLHYVWNANSFNGLKEFDNTDYTKPENNVSKDNNILF